MRKQNNLSLTTTSANTIEPVLKKLIGICNLCSGEVYSDLNNTRATCHNCGAEGGLPILNMKLNKNAKI